MARNLPHIASMAFNEPLLLEPAYARVFFSALAQEIGAGKLIDTGGTVIEAHDMTEQAIGIPGRQSYGGERSYDVQQGIALLPISGTLVSKMGALRPYSGMTGYNGVIARVELALADPDVKGILLDMDTPGGMVAGAFDAADMIARYRSEKPIWALANDMHCSAGQLIASACSRRLVTQTARAGSIGVIMAHSNYGAALEQNGVEITLIYSGSHKVDGNPYERLPDNVRADFQRKIDATRLQFAEKVSQYSGVSLKDVIKTEAQVYTGQEAVDIGLSDELVINADAISVMADAVKTKIYPVGGMMSENNITESAATGVMPESAVQNSPGITAEQLTAAVSAERDRMMGILNCEEAQGRETLAAALANTEGMSVANAQRLLSASAQSPQARSGTGLDSMMENSAPALGANGQQTDDDNWADIPV